MASRIEWTWVYEKAVADRCDERFQTTGEIKEYLVGLGWDKKTLARMIKYIKWKRKCAKRHKCGSKTEK